MLLPEYLVDTNTCIYITKHKPINVINKFRGMQPGSVAMSVVNYGELYYGTEKSIHSKKSHAALEALIGVIPVLPMPTEAAKQYGHIRAYLEKKGEIIGNNDLWIAAHCLALGIILVTNNTKEFKRVPNLRTEDWV
ncbi:MAG: type II toxin-antitoxin system VapC family toxin [Gammaproteobacteria bacterium]|nr:type II toxin-antitoxin system VapC family toxin [Gammaproteobacteria bacterium]